MNSPSHLNSRQPNGVILFESSHRSLQMGAVLSSTSFPNSGIASPIQRAPIIPPNKIPQQDNKTPKESITLPIKEQLGKEI